MLVVPEREALVVEARLMPQDIDQVRPGQAALLRFPAFNQRTTPELAGTVASVSADVLQDQKTGQPYFTMRIVVPDEEVTRPEGQRSVLSYLLRPLGDQLARAMRER